MSSSFTTGDRVRVNVTAVPDYELNGLLGTVTGKHCSDEHFVRLDDTPEGRPGIFFEEELERHTA
ncbi:hypothetical protein CTZ27_33130 [Streptomyces griseocarneus]|nr:hypothetical protein CTZ27_33130 [Streptomyces griseocarneus]